MNGIPWRNLHNPTVVLETTSDPDEASGMLHRYAKLIKRHNVTERFGVSLRKVRGVHQVVLHDRFAERRTLRGREAA
ncbi:hypothetical protein [Streptomyces pseudogriseolus]|uniref:hypothetical protein n=1 Tax=Streptomyces pseudogriseolus TaxID=36817 RepID=UPI003FA27093